VSIGAKRSVLGQGIGPTRPIESYKRMKWDNIILNGTIVTPEKSFNGNVYIKNEKIAAISSEYLPGETAHTTDATGLHVLPGLIDTHVHSRDGGAPEKEDFFHSTQAAAVGGLTTIFEMPNTIPAISDVEKFKNQIKNLTPKAHVDFAIWGLCLGRLNNKDLAALANAGVIAFKYFWGYAITKDSHQLIYNYGKKSTNVIPALRDGEIYEIFEEVAKTGKLLAIHAENSELIELFSTRMQKTSDLTYKEFLKSRPNIAEETAVQTAISFAKNSGLNLHILHASTREAIELVRTAQKQGYPITVETCPHYLFLDDEDFNELGPKMKVYPLIKCSADQEMLWNGINEGIISLVCSDHAPHTKKEKEGALWEIPAGMCGVETLVPMMLHAVNTGRISLNQLVSLLSKNPAQLFRIYPQKGSLQVGTDADITLIDMNKKFTIRENELHSIGKITAFDGMTVQGMPVGTIVRGNYVMREGTLVSKPFGKIVISNHGA